MEHVAATVPNSNSAYEGLWLWMRPTLAINYYGEGLSLERIVPTGPNTTEIRYIYLFRKLNDTDPMAAAAKVNQQKLAIDTSTEVPETYL